MKIVQVWSSFLLCAYLHWTPTEKLLAEKGMTKNLGAMWQKIVTSHKFQIQIHLKSIREQTWAQQLEVACF